jgi:hypothetical protein
MASDDAPCPQVTGGLTSIVPKAIEALPLNQVAKPFVIAVNLCSDGGSYSF